MEMILENLPKEIINRIMIFNSHPLADVFKKELEEELEDHYRVLREGPGGEANWCADDNELFAYEHLKKKLSDNGKERQMWQRMITDKGKVNLMLRQYLKQKILI
jgi:hypothetical protein